MKQQVSSAIILHHTDYGESDRIVTFLTPDHGRLKGFARAARKSRKRFGAALEPFAEVQLHWVARSSGDLISLRDAELVKLRSGLRRDLETLTLAGYGCELTEALFDESGIGVEVFQLLQAFLDHLDSDGFSVEARLLMELRMLSVAGYVPHLQHCADCFGPLPSGLLTPLTSFADFKLSPRSRREGRMLLNDALRCHLHRPLKSLEMLNRFSPEEPIDTGS
jgi:DNA repair protein RecO (recombination protein O)